MGGDDHGKVDGKKWEGYFTRLYQQRNKRRLPPVDQNGTDPNNPLNRAFTLRELNHVIDKLLKYNKALGQGKIKAEFLKAAPQDIQKILLRLLNEIYKSHTVPKT